MFVGQITRAGPRSALCIVWTGKSCTLKHKHMHAWRSSPPPVLFKASAPQHHQPASLSRLVQISPRGLPLGTILVGAPPSCAPPSLLSSITSRGGGASWEYRGTAVQTRMEPQRKHLSHAALPWTPSPFFIPFCPQATPCHMCTGVYSSSRCLWRHHLDPTHPAHAGAAATVAAGVRGVVGEVAVHPLLLLRKSLVS